MLNTTSHPPDLSISLESNSQRYCHCLLAPAGSTGLPWPFPQSPWHHFLWGSFIFCVQTCQACSSLRALALALLSACHTVPPDAFRLTLSLLQSVLECHFLMEPFIATEVTIHCPSPLQLLSSFPDLVFFMSLPTFAISSISLLCDFCLSCLL